MNYIPKYFTPEELFPKQVIQNHTLNGKIKSSIWRLIDSRVAWTADQLRKLFGPLTVNDYKFGGPNQYRGLRPAQELIDWEHYNQTGELKTIFSSFTSQHCFGRALDMVSKSVSAEEIRVDIKKNPRTEYQHITAIEDGVSWLHFDVRNNGGYKGILFFNP